MFFDNSLSVIGFYILDFCKICNQSISSISKKLQKNSIITIGIQRDNQFHRIQNMDVLQKGDIVYFFCSEINLKQLRKILGYLQTASKIILYSSRFKLGITSLKGYPCRPG